MPRRLNTIRKLSSRVRTTLKIALASSIVFSVLTPNTTAGDLDKLVDAFFQRYRDYPQMYQDMAFIVGNWDFLETKLRKETSEVLAERYRVLPGETATGRAIVSVCNRRSLPYGMEYTFHITDMPRRARRPSPF